MYFCNMIIVTGAAGFIGSCLVSKLNSLGKTNLVLVDDFSNVEKNKNLAERQFLNKIERSVFVGDSKGDQNAASKNGVPFIFRDDGKGNEVSNDGVLKDFK